jgi:hypothetical protein
LTLKFIQPLPKSFLTLYRRESELIILTPVQAGESILGALRVGCVPSGGQTPGSHNIIIGLYDYIKRFHKNLQLLDSLKVQEVFLMGIILKSSIHMSARLKIEETLIESVQEETKSKNLSNLENP